MPSMKDMAQKHNLKKQKGPGAQRKINKNKKKELDKALKQALALSVDGQIAVMQDGKYKHIMIREDKLQEAITNLQQGLGFVVKPEKELLEYNKLHQEVLIVMSKLDYEELGREQFDTDDDYELHKTIIKRNQDLFDDIDQFTFQFSEGLMKGKRHRVEVKRKYEEFRKDHPEIEDILKSKVVEHKVV